MRRQETTTTPDHFTAQLVFLRRCEQIDNILTQALETKKADWEKARCDFARIVGKTLLASRTPIEVSCIQEAGTTLGLATEQYRRALNEFNAFVLKGVFPDRLKS